MSEETAIRIANTLDGIEAGIQIIICLIIAVIAGFVIDKIVK